MLRLEPLIARLVDDVLRAIREASIEELRDLLPATETSSPPRGRAARPAAAPVPRPRHEAIRPTKRARVVRTERAAAHGGTARPEIHSFEEITDPERLLGLVWPALPQEETYATTAVPAAQLDAAPAEDEPPRPSAPARAPLRAGETVIRDNGAGVVTRRAKRA
jgi:hypothetical protein